jgi:electron transfer flavoprotein alpha subunit
MKGILICGELENKEISSISKELICTGHKLQSALDQSLDYLLIGENLQERAKEAAAFGVSRVLTVQSPEFSEFHPERLTEITAAVCRQIEPLLILLGQTDLGRDVAPRLAAKLEGNVCLDCVDLVYDQKKATLIQTKPVYGGNALAQWAAASHHPHIVTMRPRSEKPAEPNPSNRAEIISIPVEIDKTQIKSQLLKTLHEEDKGIRLEQAKIIVAGGGGIGGSAGFDLVRELAQELGAAVGITRVPADEHWMPKSLEIGQTGHIVGPDLYIAVGISGAPQHLAGCSGSKVIIAINKEPQARIFEESDFGIVGDYRDILPALIEKLKDLSVT